MIRLEQRRGPLTAPDLAAIAGLYGAVDLRFQSIEYLRIVFDLNPYGGSYHVYAYDEVDCVGHYAVIPIPAHIAMTDLVCGKGEAMFLKDEYRTQHIELNGSDVPVGFALMKSAHDFALANGVSILLNITSPEIGLLQRFDGFQPRKIERRNWYAITHAKGVSRFQSNWKMKLFGKLVEWFYSSYSIFFQVGKRIATYSLHERSDEGNNASEQTDLWAIKRDSTTLKWYDSLGELLLFVHEDGSKLAVRDDGMYFTIFECKAVKAASVRSLVSRATRLAYERKRAMLGIADEMVEANNALAHAVKSLHFIQQASEVHLFVKSTEGCPASPIKFQYDTFLHI